MVRSHPVADVANNPKRGAERKKLQIKIIIEVNKHKAQVRNEKDDK